MLINKIKASLKIQYFFIFLALVMLIFGLLNKENSIPIAMYGVVLEINIFTFSIISTIFFLLVSINYFSLFILNKPSKLGFNSAHIFFQSLALILLFYVMLASTKTIDYSEVARLNIILILSTFLFIISVFLHLISFFSSLIRN